MKNKNTAHLLALVTAVMWSSSYLFTRIALRDFSSYGVALLRLLFASLVLAGYLLLKRAKLPAKRDLPKYLLSGAMGFGLFYLVYNTGMAKGLNTATSCTLVSTAPLFTALIGRVFLKEKLSVAKWCSILIAFAGVLVLTWEGLTMENGVSGILWLLATALLLAGYNIYQRHLVQGKDTEPLVVTAWSIFFGTLLLTPFLPQTVAQLSRASALPVLCCAVLGIGASATGYVMWGKALKIADNVSTVSNYILVEPFSTALLGAVFLGETLTAPTLIGGGIILAGLFLFYFLPEKKA
ncbi:MAG: EamA family transporter [Clostridia bacterium]|nr:EamA family transporter [Clostridia bacterium]